MSHQHLAHLGNFYSASLTSNSPRFLETGFLLLLGQILLSHSPNSGKVSLTLGHSGLCRPLVSGLRPA
jgi:hypothetical protein